MFAEMDHGGGMVMDHGSMTHVPAMSSETRKPNSSSVPIRMASALDQPRSGT